MIALTVEALIKIGIVLGGVMTAVAYLVLLERWIAAWVQDRKGPNRVGIPLTNWKLFGLGQPLADGLKFLLKEAYTPGHVDKAAFVIAPIVILAAALLSFAVVPFGKVRLGWGADSMVVDMTIAPGLDVALIYMFAMSGLAVYGVIVGGWASNNKYSFLGGLRASAQLISYEIPLGLGILGVVLASGSLRIDNIVQGQTGGLPWYCFTQPLGLLVFFIASLAESARLPFDLPECEQELIGGYHTEYSGMKLAAFLMAEFIHMVTAAFLTVHLYFGGWNLPFITSGADEVAGPVLAMVRIGVLLTKVLAVIVLIMLIRWSWPRFRFDQLMDRAWKGLLPLGLFHLFLTACVIEANAPWPVQMLVGWGGMAVGLYVVAVASGKQVETVPRNMPLAAGAMERPS